MEYLKIWTSFAEIIEPLNDSERGRLFTAMLEYAASGVLPELKGNERYVWPVAKQAIDRARTESGKLTENGSKGGRPKTKQNQTKPNETNENQSEPNESHKDKDKEKDKDKDNKKNDDDDTARARETAFGTVQADPVILAVQQNIGELTAAHYDDLEAFRQALGDELVIEAINEAVAHSARSWAYARRVLQGYARDGIRTVGDARKRSEQRARVTQGGKTVTAQNYTQREYTEDELEARTVDILEEARRA